MQINEDPLFKLGFAAVFLLVFAAICPLAHAEDPWTDGANARAVWGQPDFSSSDSGQSNLNLNVPDSIAADPTTGKVFVSDAGNHRVLRFASFEALESGAAAEGVLGQGDFNTVIAAGTRSRMDNPKGISLDAQGRLWVADSNNHRVLRFDNASSKVNGSNADGVLGQPDFTTTEIGAGAAGMGYVAGVLADAAGRVWVSDWDNKRVIRFDNAASKSPGADADGVLGQPDFETLNEVTDQASLISPAGLAMDASGNLWVADIFQARVLMFQNAAGKPDGAGADLVLGQLNFTTANMNQTSWGLSQPSGLAIDANGTLWVTDQLFHRVLRFENAALLGHGASAVNVLGQPHFEIADWGTTRKALNTPEGVAVDASGEIWVADRENHRLLKFGPDGYRPDALIGPKRNELMGDDHYTNLGDSQTIDLAVSGNRTRRFFFSAQNDGTAVDDLLVKGSRKNRKISVKYFRLTNPRENVTAKISRGGCTIPDLDPGRTIRFKAQVTAGDSSPRRNLTKTLKILTKSESTGARDKAKVNVTTAR